MRKELGIISTEYFVWNSKGPFYIIEFNDAEAASKFLKGIQEEKKNGGERNDDMPLHNYIWKELGCFVLHRNILSYAWSLDKESPEKQAILETFKRELTSEFDAYGYELLVDEYRYNYKLRMKHTANVLFSKILSFKKSEPDTIKIELPYMISYREGREVPFTEKIEELKKEVSE